MSNFDEEAYKESQLLASDFIINYRTVASLNADNAITNNMMTILMDQPKEQSELHIWWDFGSEFLNSSNMVYMLFYFTLVLNLCPNLVLKEKIYLRQHFV